MMLSWLRHTKFPHHLATQFCVVKVVGVFSLVKKRVGPRSECVVKFFLYGGKVNPP